MAVRAEVARVAVGWAGVERAAAGLEAAETVEVAMAAEDSVRRTAIS